MKDMHWNKLPATFQPYQSDLIMLNIHGHGQDNYGAINHSINLVTMIYSYHML